MDYVEDTLPLRANEREARGADPFCAQTALLHGQLDVLDKLGMGVQMKQRSEPAVNLPGLLPIPTPVSSQRYWFSRGKAMPVPATQPSKPSTALSRARSSTPVKIA